MECTQLLHTMSRYWVSTPQQQDWNEWAQAVATTSESRACSSLVSVGWVGVLLSRQSLVKNSRSSKKCIAARVSDIDLSLWKYYAIPGNQHSGRVSQESSARWEPRSITSSQFYNCAYSMSEYWLSMPLFFLARKPIHVAPTFCYWPSGRMHGRRWQRLGPRN